MTIRVTNEFPLEGIFIEHGNDIHIKTPEGKFWFQIKDADGTSISNEILNGEKTILAEHYYNIPHPFLYIKSDDIVCNKSVEVQVEFM